MFQPCRHIREAGSLSLSSFGWTAAEGIGAVDNSLLQ
jgi:hypothetical protein